jgi:hypothetical protein
VRLLLRLLVLAVAATRIAVVNTEGWKALAAISYAALYNLRHKVFDKPKNKSLTPDLHVLHVLLACVCITDTNSWYVTMDICGALQSRSVLAARHEVFKSNSLLVLENLKGTALVEQL